MSEGPIKIADSPQMEKEIPELTKLRDAFATHTHCIRCKGPMQIGQDTNDGVCLVCKEKSKEQMKHLGRPPPAF